jgi:hypothetical protein
LQRDETSARKIAGARTLGLPAEGAGPQKMQRSAKKTKDLQLRFRGSARTNFATPFSPYRKEPNPAGKRILDWLLRNLQIMESGKIEHFQLVQSLRLERVHLLILKSLSVILILRVCD